MGRRRAALEDPAGVLADRLRHAGRGDVQAFLAEVIPTGPVGSDEHLALLTQRLNRIAAEDSLDRSIRDEAARLAAVAVDLPTAIGRAGRVWISWWQPRRRWDTEPNHRSGHYSCLWGPDSADLGENELYEDGPDLATLDEALAWARRRSADVVVRPAWDSATHYWAGEGPPPDEEMPPLTVR